MIHQPVLLQETLQYLQVKKNGLYIDATFGMGGHSRLILEQGGKVLGFDADENSLKVVKENFANNPNLILVHANFETLENTARAHGFGQVDGILMDLGLSQWQLKFSDRGFSFAHNERLDMRMNDDLAVTAADLLKVLTKNEMEQLFIRYGEEPLAREIAAEIVRIRTTHSIETTADLSDIIENVYRRKYHTKSLKNPSTKVFQALRIAVNDELHVLESTLPQTLSLLKSHGRLCVITFHSLEDREVKRFFKEQEQLQILTKKPITPSLSEIDQNPSSRSAKLRVAAQI